MHKHTVLLGIATVALGSFTQAHATLSAASDFNLFALGNVNQNATDIEGKAAIAGSASFSNMGIGSQLPNSNGSVDVLVVGGHLSFANGQVNAGNLVYGSSASLSNFGVPNGAIRVDAPIDFITSAATLRQWATELDALVSNGSTVITPWNAILLTGSDTALNVFTLQASALASATSFNLLAPAGSTVLINVEGTAVTMQNFGFLYSGVAREQVLFNMLDATSLTMQGISIEGSILAPWANTTFNNGQMNGQLITVNLQGGGELHHHPFTGTLPPPGGNPPTDPPTSPAIPEPLSAGTALLGLLALCWRRTGR